MPRQSDKYRNIEIAITEEAVEEALALWITQFHGIKVDRKHIEIVKDGDKLTARITKRAKSGVQPDVVSEAPVQDSVSTHRSRRISPD